MRESLYQRKLIEKIKHEVLPGCLVLKNDSSYIQGIPDWSIFYGPRWAMLEIKASARAATQPNQEYYVNELNFRGFAAFIYPENEEEVLDALQRALLPSG